MLLRVSLPLLSFMATTLVTLTLGKSVSIDDLLENRYGAKTSNLSWSGGSSLSWQEAGSGDLVVFDVMTKEKKRIVEGSRWRSKVGPKARFMGMSGSVMLFAKDMLKVWDFSFEASYTLFDLDTDQLVHLNNGHRLRYVSFLPRSSSLILVKENDVYYQPQAMEPDHLIRVTHDGVVDEVFNGVPDWVHEVEVMYRNNALYPSPDSNFLAMVQFDDRAVHEYTYPMYGRVADLLETQYPVTKRLRYPKVGTTNPTTTVFVQNMEELRATGQSQLAKVVPPKEALDMGELGFNYIKWMNDQELFVLWKNRPQNRSVLALCKHENGQHWPCRTVHTQAEPDGWLPWAFSFGAPVSHSSGRWALLIEKKHVAEDDSHYYHIIKFDLIPSHESTPRFITSGRFVVSKIIGWDEQGQRVFFTASLPDQPGVRHLFSVSEDGSESEPTCVTCSLSMPDNEGPCLYNDAVFSPDFKLFVHQCSGPNVPQTLVRSTEHPEFDPLLLENNDELKERLRDVEWPEVVRLNHQVKSRKHPGKVYSVPVLLKLPSEESRGHSPNESIPLVVEVFAGPNSQKISSKWSVEWGEILTSTYGVAHAFIDGRGTGFQSTEFMFECYKHLGSVEVEDQISATKMLLDTFGVLDSNRVSIWGSSYGGFMTLMTLAQDVEQVFGSGIAVSAIPDSLLHNTMSSERYMNLAESNWLGYENSSVLKRAEHLKDKRVMINHGVADENAHVQQVMLLFRELIERDIQFEQKLYPDQGHNILGEQQHLYRNMEHFWNNVLRL